ncbi:nose resistant to fluoxetine protein 6-like [Oratosquilla oratoria]|uniref:nose resistant to fluoxetine protein 6-like n=1 Tax=Oratosquilla oratoria TaxID=337810 RepID=UPI003F76844A
MPKMRISVLFVLLMRASLVVCSEKEHSLANKHLFKAIEDKLYSLNKGRGVWGPQPSELRAWTSVYLPSLENNMTSVACRRDLVLMKLALDHPRTMWPLRMIDSWGKLSDGILWGNFKPLGNYHECLETSSVSQRYDVKGKYCAVSYSTFGLKKFNNTAKKGEPLRIATFPIPMGERGYSTCIPSSCTEEDLKATLVDVLEDPGVGVRCHTKDQTPEFLAGDIFVIILLSFLLMLIVVASVADVYINLIDRQTLRTGMLRFLLVFSLRTNLKKIFHISEKRPPGTIACIHGIRVLSMCWVVYGHQQIVNFTFFTNLFFFSQKTRSLFFQIIINTQLSVDTFFFMSGLLVSYGALRKVQRRGRLDVIKFFVHRIIRLMPTIALVCALNATVFRYFVSGPLSHHFDEAVRPCRTVWWKELLFVNNFFTSGGSCIEQNWYTAVDTQLYLIAPVLILSLYFDPVLGRAILYVLSLLSVLSPAMIIRYYDLPPTLIESVQGQIVMEEYRTNVYLMPWCRAGPWIVGIGTGYLLFNLRGKDIGLTPFQAVAGWTVSVFLALSVLLGTWSYQRFDNREYYDVMTQFFYGGFHRTAWALAVAWVVFVCHTGYGGAVNAFLSYPAWQPISRLTYAIFLTSFSVQLMMAYSLKTGVYYEHTTKILETCGSLFVAGVVATLASVSVELPALEFEKLFFRKSGH